MTDRQQSSFATGIDERILSEHNRIQELNRQLQTCSDLTALLACVVELRAFLVRHFAAEEEPGGFFDTVRDLAPGHHARVDALEREHAVMLAELDALAARANACLGAIAAVQGDARAVGHRLAAHETAEDHVLIDTMYTDLGQAG
jgi:hypothetical protein